MRKIFSSEIKLINVFRFTLFWITPSNAKYFMCEHLQLDEWMNAVRTNVLKMRTIHRCKQYYASIWHCVQFRTIFLRVYCVNVNLLSSSVLLVVLHSTKRMRKIACCHTTFGCCFFCSFICLLFTSQRGVCCVGSVVLGHNSFPCLDTFCATCLRGGCREHLLLRSRRKCFRNEKLL